MNKVVQFLDGISEDDLRTAVHEMKHLDTDGVLADGVVRRLSVDLAEYAEIRDLEARKVVEVAVLRLAAYRWAGV
ncbi:hypothetical protein LGM58_35830 [Burkholderia contaminans]|uniref:hypothetical protein n=1 Tax=Burkholderia contaminans TaxID=488447 RepID=UPI001CF1BC89|nr:hypothetical protein [Burkholderia contaminans]MCA7888555.1 hypothetical protein [Burkholderia contaminans]